MRQIGLAPICDRSTRILIVGTFPSQKSLALAQYYANPQNNFWRILSGVLGKSLVEMNYADRIQTLLASGIGLWDAIENCERDGSMDHKIFNPQFNDFQGLRTQCPLMRAFICNGKLAASTISGKVTWACLTVTSSSPANTGKPLKEKIELWRATLCRFI